MLSVELIERLNKRRNRQRQKPESSTRIWTNYLFSAAHLQWVRYGIFYFISRLRLSGLLGITILDSLSIGINLESLALDSSVILTAVTSSR
jgi:hypothetical protein